MNKRRRLDLVADASFDADAGMAGIGVAFRGGRLICADAIHATDVNQAEYLAAIRACQMLAVRHAIPGSRIFTDSQVVSLGANGTRDHYGHGAELRKMLSDHGWVLEQTRRDDVGAAHTIAREALQIWRAGLGQSATWVPTSYMKAAAA